MKHKPRGDMSKLIWNFNIPILLLVALIVVAYLAYGIVNANNNAKQTKQLLIQQSVQMYQTFGKNFQNLSRLSTELLNQFNIEIVRAAYSGNPRPMYGLTKNLMLLTNPAIYVAVIENGKIVDTASAYGTIVNPQDLPTKIPAKGYLILNDFGGKKGTFVNLFSNVDLNKLGIRAKFTVSFVIDTTDQVKEIDTYFKDQKNNTIVGLVITGIIALILFGLLTTFWLRYLIDKYIRKPVEELNTMARDLANGTYEGEVVVDENSDFAALQGLLKSGQLILRRFNENMGDKS